MEVNKQFFPLFFCKYKLVVKVFLHLYNFKLTVVINQELYLLYPIAHCTTEELRLEIKVCTFLYSAICSLSLFLIHNLKDAASAPIYFIR